MLVEDDLAIGDFAGLADEAHDGEGGDAFAAARFTDEAQDFAFADEDIDAVDGADDACFGEKLCF